MKQDLKQIFKNSCQSPDSKLCENVWCTILEKEAKQRKVKSLIYSSLGVISIFALIPIVGDLISQFSKSGFYEYASLAFSDSGSIATHFQEFTLSVVDSLPLVSIMSSLALVFILFISIRKVVHQFRFNNQLQIA